MATNRKLCDISGVPFVIEERDGEKFIVGVKVRRSVLKIEGSGIPVDVVDKIDGVSGDQKINGVEEIEGTRFSDAVPSEFVSDDDVEDAWREILGNAKNAAGGNQE